MSKVNELITEIRERNGKDVKPQRSASQKDELRVMREMLNDREYEVGIYNANGLQGTLNPAKEARSMISSVISNAVSMKQAEAETLADAYEFKKAEAQNMINISKEFVNTYIETGRKLPLGGRELSNVSLCQKEVPESDVTYPKRVGVREDGSAIIENGIAHVNAHKSVRVIAPCPAWVK